MIIEIFLIICLSIITLRIIVFLAGIFLERKKGLLLDPDNNENIDLPFVSIVVPARNEEENIENCIRSLANSNYGTDNFEIIAVNDRSTDNTLSILNRLKTEIPNLKIIDRDKQEDHINLQGKPGALQAGIELANAEIILMTDADCIVHPKWIRIISSFFADPEIGLVAGYTAIKSKKIFDKIQAVEWTYLHAAATAGVGLNTPLGCYGNNIAVRKSYFNDIGGYYKVNFSVTEDLALLQAMHKEGFKIRYLTHEFGTVTTIPCPTFKDYIKQHHRWTIGALDLGYKAFIWVITSLAFWVGFVISAIFGEIYWVLLLIGVRFIGDMLLTIPTAKILKQKHISQWTIPSIFFFLFMELVSPFLLLNKNVKWKDQTFSTNPKS